MGHDDVKILINLLSPWILRIPFSKLKIISPVSFNPSTSLVKLINACDKFPLKIILNKKNRNYQKTAHNRLRETSQGGGYAAKN